MQRIMPAISSESDTITKYRPFKGIIPREIERRPHRLLSTPPPPPVTGEFPAQRANNAEKTFHLMTLSRDGNQAEE